MKLTEPKRKTRGGPKHTQRRSRTSNWPRWAVIATAPMRAVYRWFVRLPLKARIALIGTTLLVVLVLIPLMTYLYFANAIASKERLMNQKDTGVVLLDRNGTPFYSLYDAEQSVEVDFKEMPESVRNALVAAEDRDFYKHSGFSLKAIGAALYADVLNQELKYGGSTITQQLVKNALLSQSKNFLRKYQEVILAIAIEQRYEKEDILEMYLNSVYFGEGAFGIESAAQAYYGKSAKRLSLAESAMLIGILPAPSAYSPVSGDKEAAETAQELVLNRMVDAGYISREEADKAIAQKLSFRNRSQGGNRKAHHFAEMVHAELIERYGEEEINRSGFQVKTTLDLKMQDQAEDAVKNQVAAITPFNATNGAAVAMDPKTGEIRALVGSVNYFNKRFGTVNMATQPRQPGSSFKPIYYTKAIEDEVITAATILHDKPTDFGGGYRPNNFDLRFRGDVTARRALANSLNVPAVEVLQKLGIDPAVEFAEDIGISTLTEPDKYGLSMALGTAEVPLLEMTNAYGTFANKGVWQEPTTILSIDTKFGDNIFKAKENSKRVLSEEAAFIVSSILSDNNARQDIFGASLTLSRTAAVKTGSTESYVDALTIGYTPSVVVGVWVGNNDHSAMQGVAGSMGAAPIWRNLMEAYWTGQPIEQFNKPDGIEEAFICTRNGGRAESNFAGTYTEYFIGGTVPTEGCNAPAPKPEKPEKKEDDENLNEGEETPPEEDEDDGSDEETPPPDEEEPTDPEEPTTSSGGIVGQIISPR